MKLSVLIFFAAILLNAKAFASVDKVTKELTLLNIGHKIQTTLKVYHSACNALVDLNGNKVIRREIINEPKPITINRPKRAIENEIKPVFPSHPKRAVENEIKPISPDRPKSIELVNCTSFQKELAVNLYAQVENLINNEGLNVNEYSEVLDLVKMLQENMENPNNDQAVASLIDTKRIYRGLELVKLILDNGLVPPTKLFNINAFIDQFTQTVTK